MVDDWVAAYDADSCLAALQLLNCVLWACNVRQELRLSDLEREDPALMLAELQEGFEAAGAADYPLSARNKTKLGKTLTKNYSEFWSRWACSVLSTVTDTEKISRLVITWLMTMTSSGYRPLRHASTTACFNVLLGCSKKCSNLSNELDDVSRLLSNQSVLRGGASADLVDSVSCQLASLEKLTQMLFDGVFVQRFRDVDQHIRAEAVSSLVLWTEAYTKVFLDNSYLRYLGWALSDRSSLVRNAALEALGSLLCNVYHQESLTALTLRFKERLLEMAERDVEMSVRNQSCEILTILYKADMISQEDLQELVFDFVRYEQKITNKGLGLLKAFLFDGASYEKFRDRLGLLLINMKNRRSEDVPELVVVQKLVTFFAKALEDIPYDHRILAIEYFVANAKTSAFPCLKDLDLLLSFFQLVQSGALVNSACDSVEWKGYFDREGDVFTTLTLMQAVSRYGFVFINSPADNFRQMSQVLEAGKAEEGAPGRKVSRNNSNSVDLARKISILLTEWVEKLNHWETLSAECLAPFFDFVCLAEADELWMRSGPKLLVAMESLIGKCNEELSCKASARLLEYWLSQNVVGVAASVQKIIADQEKVFTECCGKGNSEINWNGLLESGACLKIAHFGSLCFLEDLVSWQKTVKTIFLRMETAIVNDPNSKLSHDLAERLAPSLIMIFKSNSETLMTNSSFCTTHTVQQVHDDLCSFFDLKPWVSEAKGAQIVVAGALLEAIADVASIAVKCERSDIFLQALSLKENTKALIYELIQRAVLSSLTPWRDQDGEGKVEGAFAAPGLLHTSRLFSFGILGDEAVAKVFQWYPVLCRGAAGRLFPTVWRLVVDRLGSEVLRAAGLILESLFSNYVAMMASMVGENVFIESSSMVAKMIADTLKENSGCQSAEKLLELHVRVLESCIGAKPANSAIIGSFLDRVLVQLVPFLSPNLAGELLLNLRREVQKHPEIASPVYAKTLERALNRRVPVPFSKRGNLARAAGMSKLRDTVSSSGDADPFSEPSVDHLMTSEGDATLEEMADLRMSSELALPPSSPLNIRKRTIRI